MELRKKVKRPQRYEPELLTRLDPTYAPRSTRPAFHIDYVDFNPALPPAKFPTLEHPKVAEQSEQSQTRSSRSDPSALSREAGTSERLPPDQAQELLDLPYNAVARLQQLQEPRKDNKEESYVEELEISDEEGGKGAKARSKAAPRWMNLPVPLQLAIVDAMFTNITLGTVFKRLRLTSLEQRKILTEQWRHRRRRRKEDSSIEAMHAEQLRLLLHDHDNGLDAITRSEFCKTFEEHLYKHINVEEDHHTITKKNLVDAQTFLRRMGLEPDLAGDWTEIGDHDLANEPQPVPVSSDTDQSAGTKLKLIMSMPSGVPPQPFAVTKHQTPALGNSLGRTNATLPVKRVLFADKARGPRSMGVAAAPASELEFASIRVLPPSNQARRSWYKSHKVGMKDNATKTEQTSSK